MQNTADKGKHTYSVSLEATNPLQCDKLLPVCQRCAKSHRICVKRNTANHAFSIHMENQYASGSVKRPRGPRSTVPLSLNVDLQNQATVYYLNHHLQTPPEIQKMLGSVQDSVCEWASSTKYSIIDLAISAMALAVFSRTQRHSLAAAKAAERYARLLRTAQVELPGLARTEIDAALLAIFLMSRYEDSMHNSVDPSSPAVFKSFAHHDGAAAVLRLWQERSLGQTEPPTMVIKHTRRGVLRSALLRHQAVPAGLEDGGQFGEFGPELGFDRLLVGIASLRQQLSELQQEIVKEQAISPDLASWAQALNAEAKVLSLALQDWATRAPSTWMPRRHFVPAEYSVPRKHFFSAVVFSYPSIAYAAIWLNYFVTDMLFHRAWLKVLELVRPSSDELAGDQQRQEEHCCSRLTAMADALASSLPFAMDRFTVRDSSRSSDGEAVFLRPEDEDLKPYLGNLTAWPLSLASCIGGLDTERRNWFRSELMYVGRVVGAGVLEVASAQYWPTL